MSFAFSIHGFSLVSVTRYYPSYSGAFSKAHLLCTCDLRWWVVFTGPMIYLRFPCSTCFTWLTSSVIYFTALDKPFSYLLKMFVVEVSFVLLLAVIVAASRVGRSKTKSQQPLLLTETPSRYR